MMIHLNLTHTGARGRRRLEAGRGVPHPILPRADRVID